MWGQPPSAVRGAQLRSSSVSSVVRYFLLRSEFRRLFLKQILKRRPRIVGLQTRRCGRFLFASHANLVQRTVIARILFRDPLLDRLHALEAAAGIEICALLAGVQFKPALRTLPFPRACRTLQHRSALCAPRDGARPRQVHRPRSERMIPTWRTALALRRRLARLLAAWFPITTILISWLPIFGQLKPPTHVAVLSTRSYPPGKCSHQRRKKNYGHGSKRICTDRTQILHLFWSLYIRENPWPMVYSLQ